MVSPKLIPPNHFNDGRSPNPSPSPSTINTHASSPTALLQPAESFRTTPATGLTLTPTPLVDQSIAAHSPVPSPTSAESLQKRRNLGPRLQVNTGAVGRPAAAQSLTPGLLPANGGFPLCSPGVNFLPSPTCRLQNLLPSPANRMVLSPANRLQSPVNRLLLASPRFSFNILDGAAGGSVGGAGVAVKQEGKKRAEEDLMFDDLLMYSDTLLGHSTGVVAPLTPMSAQGEPEGEPYTPRQTQNSPEIFKHFKRTKTESKEPMGAPKPVFPLENSGVDEQPFPLNVNPTSLQLSLDGTPLPNENAPDNVNKRRRVVPNTQQSQLQNHLQNLEQSSINQKQRQRPRQGLRGRSVASRLREFNLSNESDGGEAIRPSQSRSRSRSQSQAQSQNQTQAARAKASRVSRGSTKGQTDREKVSIEFLDLVKKSSREKQAGRQQEFVCPHAGCNRKFSWKWAMEEHARTHMQDSERVHICNYCGKGFFTPGCLKSHTRIHTRKPYSYVCKVDGCDKKYSTSEGLRLHTRNHHDLDKKWKCPSVGCSKSFVRQSDMRLHIIRIHSTDRPYPW